MGKLIFNAQTEPVAPVGDSKHTMYVDSSDGKVKVKDSAGCVCTLGEGGGGGVSGDIWSTGADGDCTITAATVLPACEYNFDNFTLCGNLCFCGQGIPVIKANKAILRNAICLCADERDVKTVNCYYNVAGCVRTIGNTFNHCIDLAYGTGDYCGAGGLAGQSGRGGCNGGGNGGSGGTDAGGGGGGAGSGGGNGGDAVNNVCGGCGGVGANGGSNKGGNGGYGVCKGGNGGKGGCGTTSRGGYGGIGGPSGRNGGCGGCGGLSNITSPYSQNCSYVIFAYGGGGTGGDGCFCGGNGGRGGNVCQCALICIACGNDLYLSASGGRGGCGLEAGGGNGGSAGNFYNCNGSLICGVTCACFIVGCGGNGGHGKCSRGGCGGNGGCADGLKFAGCDEIHIMGGNGGNGGTGTKGGDGGCGGWICINCDYDYVYTNRPSGGNGGTGTLCGGNGGNGGAIYKYNPSTCCNTCTMPGRGGDGGSVQSSKYGLLLVAKCIEWCGTCIVGCGGPGGNGGNGGANGMGPGGDGGNGGDGADIHIIYEDLKFRNNYSCCRVPDNLILDCAGACIKNAGGAGGKGGYGGECGYCYSPSRTTACWFVRGNGKDGQPGCTGKHCLIKVTA